MNIKPLLFIVALLSAQQYLKASTNDEVTFNVSNLCTSEILCNTYSGVLQKTRLATNPFEIVNTIIPNADDCSGAAYEDNAGLIIIEAENLVIDDTDWSIQDSFTEYTGAGYLSWDGGNNFNSPGNGLITTQIKINTPGTYRFQWRNRIGQGTNSTEHNDSWLRFPDASDFYGEKNGTRIYPIGSGQTPNPNGSGSDGWFKVYLSGTTDWTWATRTSDNDGHNIFVEFDAAGIYTMEISGRSSDHLIDRITLSNDATDPLNLDNEETLCSGTLSIDAIAETEPSIYLYPNPAQNFISIVVNQINEPQQIAIYDVKGSQILQTTINEGSNTIDISKLSSGIYFTLTSQGEMTRFIKQ